MGLNKKPLFSEKNTNFFDEEDDFGKENNNNK